MLNESVPHDQEQDKDRQAHDLGQPEPATVATVEGKANGRPSVVADPVQLEQTCKKLSIATPTRCNIFYATFLDLASQAQPVYGPGSPHYQGPPEANGAVLNAYGLPLTDPSGPVAHEQQAILDLIHLDVLGHYPADQSVDVYSRSRRQVYHIGSVTHLGYPTVVLITGDAGIERVHQGKEHIPNKTTMDEVRRAIGYFGGRVSLVDAQPVGLGIWNADGHVTLISGGRAAVLQNGKLEEVNIPRVGAQILDFSSPEAWTDFTRLQGYLELAQGSAWCRDVLQEVETLFKLFAWKGERCAAVATGVVLATWVQTLLPYRPEVVVAGPANSGKSTLFDTFLTGLYGKLAFYNDKPTEAGIRQRLTNKSLIILCDEFENDENRQRCLNLFRASTRGSEVYRGTSDQKGRRFIMRHLPWMAAIETGMSDEADRSRAIVLDMARITPEQQDKFRLPSMSDLADLGQRLLAVALRHYQRAVTLFEELKRQRFNGVHGRVVENYSVATAFHAAVEGLKLDQAKDWLKTVLQGSGQGEEGDVPLDEQMLLADILGSHLDVGHGQRRSVGEVLSHQTLYQDYCQELARHGVGLVPEKTHRQAGPKPTTLPQLPRLFFHPVTVKRYLLRGTRWEEKDIGQMLLRLEHAERDKTRLVGSEIRGVSLPRPRTQDEEEDGAKAAQKDEALAAAQGAPQGEDASSPSPEQGSGPEASEKEEVCVAGGEAPPWVKDELDIT